MDRELRKAIVAEVKEVTERVQREQWEVYNERWVRGKELGQVIACFSAGWLKTYGDSLPRTQVVVLDRNNVEITSSQWLYPLHKIQRMMISGEIKGLKMEGRCGTATCETGEGGEV